MREPGRSRKSSRSGMLCPRQDRREPGVGLAGLVDIRSKGKVRPFRSPPVTRAEKVWRLLPQEPDAAHRLAGSLRVSPVVAQLLLNRGVKQTDDARRFLDGTLSGLHPPALLPDVPGAADRLYRAVAEKRKVCVYGDYDVDGVTGTAILVTLLAKLGGVVEFHVPHRLSEGYGLNSARLRELAASGVSTVVSVDCGIASVEEAEEARAAGLELIVTDHHEMKTAADGTPILPRAACLVHPRLPGSSYPFGDLSGAGVALKLAWEVARKASGGEKTSPELREFLLDAVGLAALGLVADVVPLQDENRLLVKHGLARIAARPSVGLRALLDAALGRPEPGQDRKPVTAEDVGYRLGPRLNAAGRLQCARMVVDLLTTTNTGKAQQLAAYLEDLNQQRQTLERKITQQAKDRIEADGLADAPRSWCGRRTGTRCTRAWSGSSPGGWSRPTAGRRSSSPPAPTRTSRSGPDGRLPGSRSTWP